MTFFKFDFNSSRIYITYQRSRDYIPKRPIYVLITYERFNYYICLSDKRIGRSQELLKEEFEERKLKILKTIYSNVINLIYINNKLIFHSLKKEFTFWKRYTLYKKNCKSISFFQQFGLPGVLIKKIAWMAS